jgi:hypothetical protein
MEGEYSQNRESNKLWSPSKQFEYGFQEYECIYCEEGHYERWVYHHVQCEEALQTTGDQSTGVMPVVQ